MIGGVAHGLNIPLTQYSKGSGTSQDYSNHRAARKQIGILQQQRAARLDLAQPDFISRCRATTCEKSREFSRNRRAHPQFCSAGTPLLKNVELWVFSANKLSPRFAQRMRIGSTTSRVSLMACSASESSSETPASLCAGPRFHNGRLGSRKHPHDTVSFPAIGVQIEWALLRVSARFRGLFPGLADSRKYVRLCTNLALGVAARLPCCRMPILLRAARGLANPAEVL